MRAKIQPNGTILKEIGPEDGEYGKLAAYLWARAGGQIPVELSRYKSATRASLFDESEHPRDEEGKFVEKDAPAAPKKADDSRKPITNPEKTLRAGDVIEDADGNQYMVHGMRFGAVKLFPVQDGKAVVHNESMKHWATTDLAKAKYSDAIHGEMFATGDNLYGDDGEPDAKPEKPAVKEETEDFFAVKPEQRTIYQEGMNQETGKWVGDMPQVASEPLYTPNEAVEEVKSFVKDTASEPVPEAAKEENDAPSLFDKVPSPEPDVSPRDIADAQTEAEKTDYEFARESAIPNIGEDLKGSARHKRNAWRGLEEAEKEGNAEELLTRVNLLKNEPPDLMAKVSPQHALSTLAAHLAISSFPPEPYDAKSLKSYQKTHERYNTTPTPPETLRKQYYDAYRKVKAEAEAAAVEEVDPRKVAERIKDVANNLIRDYRKTTGTGYIATVAGKDQYNPVANALVDLVKRTGAYKPGVNGVIPRVMDFSDRLSKAYGTEVSVDHLEKAAEHVKDIMEGASFNKTFGTVEGGKKGFDAASLYVKHATRKGGRMIDATTVKRGQDFVTNTLKMRGLQWGNSVSDEERVHHLQKASEAFADLAEILDLPDSAVSLSGSIGLAIGARGTGNALAHYEPGNKVINLTRKNGVGSLAHEWGHAFDHHIAGGKLSNNGETTVADYLSGQTRTKEFRRDDKGDWIKDEAGAMKTFPLSEDPVWAAMHGVRTAMEESGFNKRLKEQLREAVKMGIVSQKKATDYWASHHEKFARTFERYIQHKLGAANRENTYLSGVEPHGFWPNGEEISKITPAIDNLMQTAKAKHFTASVELSSASREKGRWITIGGTKGKDGKRHGGSPVYIENGRITKGAPSLHGKRIDALEEEGEDTRSARKQNIEGKSYERAVWGKKARQEGINAQHLHQLAADVLAHDKEFKADLTSMLQHARETSKTQFIGGKRAGYDLRAVAQNAAKTGDDYTSIPGFDTTAENAAREYPHLFHGREAPEERLWDLLIAGNPEPMTQDDAYEQAFDHLIEQKQGQATAEDEDLPDWVTEDVPVPPASRVTLSAAFDESKHPRGQPENAGQFGHGGSSAQPKVATAGNQPKQVKLLDKSKPQRNVWRSSGPMPWALPLAYFAKAVKVGKLQPSPGKVLPGEKESTSPIRTAEIHGYSGQDVARFYASRRGYGKDVDFPPGYDPIVEGFLELIQDAIGDGHDIPASVMADYKRLSRVSLSWDQSKHHRGQPKNAGQFTAQGQAQPTTKDHFPIGSEVNVGGKAHKVTAHNPDGTVKLNHSRITFDAHPHDLTQPPGPETAPPETQPAPTPAATPLEELHAKADAAAENTVKKSAGLLMKFGDAGRWMKERTKMAYQRLEKRYGRGQALAIFAAGHVVGLATPLVFLPGSTFIGMLPFAALAETYLQLRRAVQMSAEEQQAPEQLTMDQINALGKELVETMIREWQKYHECGGEMVNEENPTA